MNCLDNFTNDCDFKAQCKSSSVTEKKKKSTRKKHTWAEITKTITTTKRQAESSKPSTILNCIYRIVWNLKSNFTRKKSEFRNYCARQKTGNLHLWKVKRSLKKYSQYFMRERARVIIVYIRRTEFWTHCPNIDPTLHASTHPRERLKFRTDTKDKKYLKKKQNNLVDPFIKMWTLKRMCSDWCNSISGWVFIIAIKFVKKKTLSIS